MRENGRSMVEMLGVLAIIGVLSVGAIAGYSKAMFKYKLNKFSESMNLLINNALQTSKSLPKSTVDGEWISHAEIMYKLGLIPDGIKYIDGRIIIPFGFMPIQHIMALAIVLTAKMKSGIFAMPW